MAKYIRMTPEIQSECRAAFMEEFEKALSVSKFSDGKLSFTKSFGTINRKARVYFHEEAWLKLTALMREFSKEVAWHATAYRIPGDNDEYLIKDILVYPQAVTSSTVDMDVEKYAQWLQQGIMADDDRFNHLNCQMHSHVNMGVFASATDVQHQEEILAQLGDDDFYIFMIWNKSLNVYIRIFDMKKNILFETTDCEWSVLDNVIGMQQFITDSKKLVEEKSYQYASARGGNYNYCSGGGYNHQNYSGPYNPTSQSGKQPDKKSDESRPVGNKSDNKGGGKKKDKKKTKFSSRGNACDMNQITVLKSDGEEYDMYDPFGYYDGPFQIT